MGKEKTVILSRAEHGVSRRKIDPDALKVLYRLTGHDHTAYLVGGGVRDLLLGREPKDFDVSTDAHPGEIKRLFKNCVLIGRRFRLAHIRFGDKIIETSTFRREPEPYEEHLKDGASYRRRDNTFGTPAEDARRRDFTINGLFYDIGTFNIIDHVGGLPDLEAGIVRCIGDPDVRFREDPVRMLRAVRFASRLSFTIERGAYAAMRRHRGEIEHAPAPRLLEEIRRLFAFRSGLPAFRMLFRSGLLAVLFPSINAELRKRSSPCRKTFWRYLGALDACAPDDEDPPPLEIVFATLLYPLFNARLDDARHGGGRRPHDEVAREVLQPVAERLALPRRAFYAAVHLLADQRSFGRTGRRFSRTRFVRRADFPDLLLMRTIHVTASDGEVDQLESWWRLYRENRRSEPREHGTRIGRRRGGAPRRRRRS